MSKKKPAEVTEEVKEVTEEMTEETRPKYPSRRYGDAEHDDRLHATLKPQSKAYRRPHHDGD